MTGFLLNAEDYKILKPITEVFTIGTDSSCHHVLFDEETSPRHARIEIKENHFIIRDLRSTLGTHINGVRISEAFLKENDQIKIGKHHFIFSLTGEYKKTQTSLKSKNIDWNNQLQTMSNIAETDFPVLILGPSGTGKEIIAETIHNQSQRSQGNFVRVNCSALTETLVESELFGHVKGSFTGALNDRKGAFETARGGTLFLDEIGDLPYGLQAKLLRALENGEIRPVGSDKTIHTNVRILAATHQNLLEKIQSHQFRMDLYYRLNVVSINAPALKDRTEDFEDLLYSFAKSFRVRFSFASIQRLKKHSWPGNIRELKNTVARASAMFPRQLIEESHVSQIIDKLSADSYKMSEPNNPEFSFMKDLEKQLIIKKLIANSGNQRRTAIELGIPKSTLHDRLKSYAINPKSFSKDQTSLLSPPL